MNIFIVEDSNIMWSEDSLQMFTNLLCVKQFHPPQNSCSAQLHKMEVHALWHSDRVSRTCVVAAFYVWATLGRGRFIAKFIINIDSQKKLKKFGILVAQHIYLPFYWELCEKIEHTHIIQLYTTLEAAADW